MSIHTTSVASAPGSTSHDTRRGVILGVILTCQLMVVLDMTIVNVALPQIQVALGFSTASLSWVLNAYALTFGGLLLLGARTGDLLGRRRTFLIGITLFTLASLAGGFATSPGMLLAARAAQGVGAAFAAPSALALLTTMFTEGKERMRAIGYYTAVSIGGSAVGLVAGGILTEFTSWRWVMFVNIPIGIALLLTARAVLPETERHSGRFDLAGALTSTLGMASLVYGFVQAATDGWSDNVTLGAFAFGGVMLVAFIVVERRSSSPITPLRLFADRNRSTSYVTRLFMVASMFGMFFFLTQFLQDVLGYTPLLTGLAFLPLTAALFLASQTSARLSSRVPHRVLMGVGIGGSVVGLLWLSRISIDSDYLTILGPLLLVGIGNGLAFVPLTAISLSGVEHRDAGAASGLINVGQQLGGALGLAVLVTVFSTASSFALTHLGSGVHEAFVYGADRAFLVAAAFLLVAWVLVVVVIRPVQATSAPQGVPVEL